MQPSFGCVGIFVWMRGDFRLHCCLFQVRLLLWPLTWVSAKTGDQPDGYLL
jgi:hypothetical protein